ncbi:hypothetical protein LguiB_004181 [Lonicera macranthoides]
MGMGMLSNSLVPEELMEEILSRLPPKSLIRFRCVSKPWNSLITNPNFINTHLTNSYKHQLLVIHNTHNRSVTKQFYCYSNQYNSFDFPLSLFPSSDSVLLWGSCNGLLCLDGLVDYNRSVMALLNPATRKFRYVELFLLSADIWYYSSTILGFGFVSKSDDYKVMEFQVYFGLNSGKIPIVVYTMSLDSRKYKCVDFPYGYLRLRNRSVSINGFLHWVSDIIVWFDLHKELFGDMSVPDSCGSDDDVERELLDRKGSLCMIVYTNRYEEMDRRCIEIWVISEYGVEESWSKLFTIAPFSVEVDALGS